MVTGTVTETSITVLPRPLIEDAGAKLLSSLGCQNVFSEEMPPIITEDELLQRIRVPLGKEQEIYEAWYLNRESVAMDLSGSSSVGYTQSHAMRINGLAFHHDFHTSYQYMQDTTDKLMWTLEKNKNFLGGNHLNEIRGLTASFTWDQYGDIYFYQSETRFDILARITETTGRSWS